MKNLNKTQRQQVKAVLKKTNVMNNEELEELRDNISISDGDIEVRETILADIDSRLNRDLLIEDAFVEVSELKVGEIG